MELDLGFKLVMSGLRAGAEAQMIATVDSRQDQIATGWMYQPTSIVLLRASREARRRQERITSLFFDELMNTLCHGRRGNSQNSETEDQAQKNFRLQPHLKLPDRRQRAHQQNQTCSYVRPRVRKPDTLFIQTRSRNLRMPKFANRVAEEEVGEEGPDAVYDY